MRIRCSIQSEVGQIKSLLLKHPKEAFISQGNIEAQWKELNYSSCPDYDKALQEYDFFVSLFGKSEIDIYYLPQTDQTGLDSLYVHDSIIMTDRGAILCNMGKEKRQGEPGAVKDYFSQLDIPIIGEITGDGRVEGGDVVFFDKSIIAVGEGYRTNVEGIQQLKNLIQDFIEDVIVVPLPHWQGPDDVLHLMSFISPIDFDLAVVYSRLMPIPFREWLLERGIKFIEVPDEEYGTMACNILAVAPRKCIMLEGNPLTKQRLEEEGVEVWEYKGEEISRKGAGGSTCLTRPLLRLE